MDQGLKFLKNIRIGDQNFETFSFCDHAEIKILAENTGPRLS